MKIATEYPTPVPIVWTLTLDDDEMAILVHGLHVARGLLNRPARIALDEIESRLDRLAIERLRRRANTVLTERFD